jgi:CubicO group peptidase (beta-lactamase class C family)
MAADQVLTRRTTMLAMAGAAAMPSLVSATATATATASATATDSVAAVAWQAANPEDAGFAADLPDKLDAAVRSGLLGGLHAVLVSRNERLVLERYYQGADESWGRPLGTVTFGPDTLHDLRSVTKSLVGLLYGIALDRGLVAPPAAPLLGQFPEYPDLAADPARALLTIENALTMTMGFAWDEQLPYTDPANSEIAMETAPDRYRFVLDRPIIAAPGARWIYSGGAVALIGSLIARGSGMKLQEFARQALFTPLGIEQFGWAEGGDGVASAASGLRLRPRDLLRLGTLVLAHGQWDDRQIVSRAWLDASFKPAMAISGGSLAGIEYGRLWYLGAGATPALAGPRRWMAGFGNGGQRVWMMPDAGLAVAILCGNYNVPDQWVTPSRIWREIVLANLLRV